MQRLPEPIQDLARLLSQRLPGREAQLRMAHAARARGDLHMRADVRPAAVLILLYPRDDQWHTVLIERRHVPGDRHAGQISFPGGRQEPGETLYQTALREGQEEIAAPPEQIARVGALTALHIPVSNYLVHPFVGFSPRPHIFIPQPSEVARIIEVPLTTLTNPSTRTLRQINLPNGTVLEDVPCFVFDEHLIWGATAMIISEFLSVIDAHPTLPHAPLQSTRQGRYPGPG
ncbi:MAG: CoA pyrophosphatase [Saprospiraceae bacterium]|nr:CoA pyrophosphatase [Saprospiraceae bacterium]